MITLLLKAIAMVIIFKLENAKVKKEASLRYIKWVENHSGKPMVEMRKRVEKSQTALYDRWKKWKEERDGKNRK